MKLFLFLVFISFVSAFVPLEAHDISAAREEYYLAVENEDKIETAEKLFAELKSIQELEGVCEIYIGSLTAMKAMHVFWPGSKLDFANDGISIMEMGLEKDPENLESLFIYGSTCFYMPFFMGKADEAESALKKILTLFPSQKENYDSEILENALLFILNEVDLSKVEKKQVHRFLAQLN